MLPSCEIIWALYQCVKKSASRVCVLRSRFVSNMICVCSCELNTWTDAPYITLAHSFFGETAAAVYLLHIWIQRRLCALRCAYTALRLSNIYEPRVCVRSLWFASCVYALCNRINYIQDEFLGKRCTVTVGSSNSASSTFFAQCYYHAYIHLFLALECGRRKKIRVFISREHTRN